MPRWQLWLKCLSSFLLPGDFLLILLFPSLCFSFPVYFLSAFAVYPPAFLILSVVEEGDWGYVSLVCYYRNGEDGTNIWHWMIGKDWQYMLIGSEGRRYWLRVETAKPWRMPDRVQIREVKYFKTFFFPCQLDSDLHVSDRDVHLRSSVLILRIQCPYFL